MGALVGGARAKLVTAEESRDSSNEKSDTCAASRRASEDWVGRVKLDEWWLAEREAPALDRGAGDSLREKLVLLVVLLMIADSRDDC
jgi:hypothetical protein